MATIPQSRLEQVIERFEEVEARMGATTDSDEIVALSREHSELKPVVDAARDLIAMRDGLEEAEAMVKGDDPEMAELAQEELNDLKARIPEAESEMQLLLLPKDADDKANIVLEVRAGTGGDEAALFAGDLFRMYSRYAQLEGWKVEVQSASSGDVGGYKEVIASVDADIFIADFNLNRFWRGQNRHRSGRGMNPALGFSGGHTLDAVDPRLPF